MTPLTDTTNRPNSGYDASALDRTDRLLLGGCVAIWLAALGAGVAATVALVDLTRGHTTSTAGAGTPWVLYTVIGVSAAVILVAIPLLLRARRAAEDQAAQSTTQRPAQGADRPVPPARVIDAPTEKLRVPPTVDAGGPLPRVLRSPASPAAPESPAVDRLWLRGAASITAAIGVATLLVSVATYLMAVDSETASWVVYGVAGVVTVGMIALPWYFLRELRAEVER